MRLRPVVTVSVFLACALVARGETLQIARGGKTNYVIVTQPNAAGADLDAARELRDVLQKVVGVAIPMVVADTPPPLSIVVGTGPAADRLFGALHLDPQEVVIRTANGRLLLAGGTPGGTLYAVSTFLQEVVGCRWWTPWAAAIPRLPDLTIVAVNIRRRPAFEYRDIAFRVARDERWAVRNRLNGTMFRTDSVLPGLHYIGFVHTFYDLVPPAGQFALHPEWYSVIAGKRQPARAQLCLSNAALRSFVAARVKERLQRNPRAMVTSVSQNDGGGFCECDRCNLLYHRYGGKSGAVLEFVNAVAAEVERPYPKVVIDTLAYSETRHPPRGIVAASNVAIRLACIECDRRVPLKNDAIYMNDLRGWRAITRHLHVWDYVADWTEYLLPLPNWNNLQPNLALFREAGVESVYEQGVLDTHGSELAELRSWVLARLLWDPAQDGDALIGEFLRGYYGARSAPWIRDYLRLMSAAPAIDRIDVLSRADALWRNAEEAAAGDDELRWRVEQSHQAVRYVWLTRWVALRRAARKEGVPWPIAQSRATVAREWLRVATGRGPSGWSPLDAFSESNQMPVAQFVSRLSVEASVDRARPQTRIRRAFVPRMPLSLMCASSVVAVLALSLGLRKRGGAMVMGIVSLALAVGAWTVLVVAPMLTLRYAAMVVACCLGSLLSGFAVVVDAGRRRRWLLPITIGIGLLIAAGAPSLTAYVRARIYRIAPSDLGGLPLDGANLDGAILDGARLRSATLTKASLQQSTLNFADLDDADLRGADLRNSMLVNSSMRGADLRGTDLRGAILVDITRTTFSGARYDGATKLPRGVDGAEWDLVR